MEFLNDDNEDFYNVDDSKKKTVEEMKETFDYFENHPLFKKEITEEMMLNNPELQAL
jgi:hypothetical protein